MLAAVLYAADGKWEVKEETRKITASFLGFKLEGEEFGHFLRREVKNPQGPREKPGQIDQNQKKSYVLL